MRKILVFLSFLVLTTLSMRAVILFQDSTNYPYTNGCIEGQGQWYCYSPSTPYLDALVTNDVLILNATNHDSVAAPTNGWSNSTELTFASFAINVTQLPATTNGGYFCQFQNNNDTDDCCHVFIDTRDTVVPGTYRLGIANFSTSFSSLVPPVNYPLDLSTGVTYTVVILFGNNPEDMTFAGATLWINPSEQDYENVVNGDDISPGIGDGFVYGTDTPANLALQSLVITQIGFSPYANAGISNVMAGTAFEDVNTTNPPVFGIEPQSQTNYSGNSTMFYAVASGVDVTYQWYSQSTGILHDDGVNIIGSTSNILTLNNLSASDEYYAVATDTYGETATSLTATNTVITTPTPPFFPASVTAVSLTNNLFTSSGFTNIALGTGPLYYQWYFAPSNSPSTYSPLAGQTSPALNLNLEDYTYSGNYYVVVSNSINGGSIAYGPTNSLTEIAPLVATIAQLHNLMVSLSSEIVANKSGTVNVNTNNVTVSGYVTTFGGFGGSYTEYFIQDASGYGIQVYLGGFGNTYTPPVGTYVTISGPVVIYHTELEIEPASPSAITTNVAPAAAIGPKLANAEFNSLVTNGLSTNAMLGSCSLVTFTNVYIYGKGGGAIANGGIFYSNSYSTAYFTIGKYSVPNNTNLMEIYQFGDNYATTPNPTLNPFDDQPVPTNCYQLTGIYLSYGGSSEIEPSRLADYVTNPPPAFAASVAQAKGVSTLTWPAQAGSTYSVYSTTNLTGPWTQAAQGLGYYPTNGVFTDTNTAAAKFYQISTP
jgi:hypothetical protein